MTALRAIPDVFGVDATGSLRAAYLLAISAVSYTQLVDAKVLNSLANAVFEAYFDSECPLAPLSATQIEDLAVLSIELMLHSDPSVLMLKH